MSNQTHIGLLGGTFDPVHWGHIRVAENVAEKLGMSQVKLVTAARPPHKLNGVSNAEGRHEMVEAAVQGRSGLEACRLELDLGISYTIDMVKHLISELPDGRNTKFSFITSAEYVDPENPHHILTWTEAEEFLSLVTLVVTPRGHCDENKTRAWVEALGLEGVRVEDVPALHVTSGMVKKALREGDLSDHMMPEAVARLIKTRGYYR